MATHVLRKFLRDTADLDDAQQSEASKKTRKRQRKTEETDSVVGNDDIVKWHVDSMLKFDRTMAGKRSNAKVSLQRLDSDQKRESKRRKASKGKLVGNSRSSCAQRTSSVHEPTFNKKKHKREEKQKSLRKIAKLLKANSRKKS